MRESKKSDINASVRRTPVVEISSKQQPEPKHNIKIPIKPTESKNNRGD